MIQKNTGQVAAAEPAEIVQDILRQQASPVMPSNGGLARRVAVLEQEGPGLVRAVKDETNADIEYLGIAGLPAGPIFYNGADGSGWVLAPATTLDDAVAPRREARVLRQVREVMPPGLTYVAHEVRPDQAEPLRAQAASSRGLELSAAEATALVGPIPPPAEAVAHGERMALRSKQVVDGLRRTGKVVAGAVVGAIAIPAAAAAAVLAAPAAMVDPIVLVALPAVSENEGAPAAWYAVVRWDW